MSIRPLNLDDNCSICLSALKDGANAEKTDLDLMKAKCGHVFHKSCLDQHMQTLSDHNSGYKNCPNCRGSLENVEILKPDAQGAFKKVDQTSARLLPMASHQEPAFHQMNVFNAHNELEYFTPFYQPRSFEYDPYNLEDSFDFDLDQSEIDEEESEFDEFDLFEMLEQSYAIQLEPVRIENLYIPRYTSYYYNQQSYPIWDNLGINLGFYRPSFFSPVYYNPYPSFFTAYMYF